MFWIQLVIESAPEQAEHLAELLSESGASAVTLQDNADQPLYEPPVGETPLWEQTRVVGLFPADADLPPVLDALKQALAPAPLPAWRTEILEDRDWSRAWMDRFHPMRFGRRLWIVPSWSEPEDAGAVNIKLDPGLAFGTGTHPTTRLCLQWLDAQAPLAGRVIDYGSGSGILAIAAAKLGAAQVLAVDNDPQALLATGENARHNGVAQRVAVAAPEAVPAQCAELVVANILAGPLIELAPALGRLTCAGGRILLSGILESQAEAVAAAYRPNFTMGEAVIEEGWARLEGTRK